MAAATSDAPRRVCLVRMATVAVWIWMVWWKGKKNEFRCWVLHHAVWLFHFWCLLAIFLPNQDCWLTSLLGFPDLDQASRQDISKRKRIDLKASYLFQQFKAQQVTMSSNESFFEFVNLGKIHWSMQWIQYIVLDKWVNWRLMTTYPVISHHTVPYSEMPAYPSDSCATAQIWVEVCVNCLLVSIRTSLLEAVKFWWFGRTSFHWQLTGDMNLCHQNIQQSDVGF